MPILALMMFLAPALGVPHEDVLQDTFKSIIVSFCALGAALLFFISQRAGQSPLRWHKLLWLPLLLCLYALGSMAWSHTYLGAVEAIRWFIFSLLLWLGLNTLTLDRLPWLAWGVHAGAVVASLWAALQFWFDLALFPQGPNPASTFINRNFFAEFVVCTLPWAMLLLARARNSLAVLVLTMTTGLVITAILMTGTRAALIALWLQLFLVWPLIAWRCSGKLAWLRWPRWLRIAAPLALLATVSLLGVLPSNNPTILAEARGSTAIERGLNRTQAITPNDHSLGIRMIMWRATALMVRAQPLTGVGAGAWENVIPLYQAEGAQTETDYYVHNEALQLVAEYGLAGWIFLLLLTGYLLRAAWRTWRAETPEAQHEQPWRAAVLCSLLALMVVSHIGFPWRMASTGALFALCLAALAASDARLGEGWGRGLGARALATALPWNQTIRRLAIAATLGCLALALVISQRAAECERKIVSAVRIALTITSSANPNDPRWDSAKNEMLRVLREGIAINPHYRKITPMAADELARWGDWANATWIWQSVLDSRPNIVAIISNIARGHASLGQPAKAVEYLERAQAIQPGAATVRSLEMVLLARSGKEDQALQVGLQALRDKRYDYDLLDNLFTLASRANDVALAERAMRLRVAQAPAGRVAGLLQLGLMYSRTSNHGAQALPVFREALAAASDTQRAALIAQIPQPWRAQLTAPTPSSRP